MPRRALNALFDPVDAAPLIYARLVFGACMAIEVFRYFEHGWISEYFVKPTFFFAYPGLEWVRPLPGGGMYALFAVAGLSALGVASGLAYRPAAVTLALAWSWVFFCDQTNYLNHGYLLCLLAWLFAVVPASPKQRQVPRWAVLLLVGQLALVYLFGAVAKLDADWFSGAVARFFLSHTEVTAGLAATQTGRIAFAVSGFLFDLLIVPALLWRRTRVVATLAACTFHLTNAWLFEIGVFPWVMLALTPVFWPPATTAPLLERLRLLPQAGTAERTPYRPLIVAGVVAWFAVQVALPLRHWLYPGQVNWTEEGHNFSWHMKLRVKRGQTRFVVTTAEGTMVVDPEDLVSPRQASKLTTRPEMIRQLAHELRRRFQATSVHADAQATLNGRPWQALIDPKVDLSTQERELGAAKWILPLEGNAGEIDPDRDGE